jgi:hypothetical protein
MKSILAIISTLFILGCDLNKTESSDTTTAQEEITSTHTDIQNSENQHEKSPEISTSLETANITKKDNLSFTHFGVAGGEKGRYQ